MLCLTTTARITLVNFAQMLTDIEFVTKNALNEFKMTLKTTKSKVSIYILLISSSSLKL